MASVYLSLGSNLGKRGSNLARGVEELKELGEAVRISSIHETPPWGEEEQGDFLNIVVRLETDLGPEALLDSVKSLETRLGRMPGPRWGPRVIDIDILDYGGVEYRSDKLILPHPELANRGFVLVPLREIAPDWRHPGTGEPVGELIEGLRESGEDLDYRIIGPSA